MRFFNFYVAYMVQKYQNESAPIFYYGKSPKTSRKHLNIPYLQALTLGRIIKMTLYLVFEYLNKLREMKATALTENAAAQYWFPLTLYLQTFKSKYP